MSTVSTVQPLPPQPPPAPPPPYTYPPITIILTIILLIFFFVGFFSIYFCRCFMQNILYTWHLRHSPTGTPVGGAGSSAAPGLDPLIVQSFPTFTYSTVKDYRKEKYGLECAICLVEFGADDILRLLTTCCHVFHQECIDLWLESHKTCPVCRRNLDAPLESPVKSPNNNNVHENSNISNENHETGSQDDNNFVSITIKEGNEEDESTSKVSEKLGPSISCSSNSGRKCYNDRNYNCGQRRENKVEKFPRSHSTGHSIFRDREEEDRFTLRLPQHVKLSLIIKGHHNSSKSWTAFGEYKDKDRTRNVSRLAEVSGGDNSKV